MENNNDIISSIDYEKYIEEAREKLEEINPPLGGFITNGVMASSIIDLYYSINDLLGYEPYLNGIGNKIDNFLTTTGFLSLLIVYKIKLKKEKQILEQRINYCEKRQEESKKYVKKF